VLGTIEAMNRTGEQLAESLRDGDYGQVADRMNESTTLLRALDPAIVGHGIGEWLRDLGARAAKPCGAGAVWVTLVDPTARGAFAARVAAAGWSVLPAVPRRQVRSGWTRPRRRRPIA
jgi:hypothetical protein